jgi:hypothetical protein
MEDYNWLEEWRRFYERVRTRKKINEWIFLSKKYR